jgi:hypothetical protein
MAAELDGFLRRELDDGPDLTEALLGAFDYFDRRTATLRDPRREWPETPRATRDEEPPT